jgi:hypothetical protein
MRGLVRNMQTFYYALYVRKEEIKDEWGNKTGEYEIIYGNPIKAKGNISAAQGETQSRQFGDTENYDKVITLCNKDIPIDEYSILWVDSSPVIKDDGSTDTPHDYIVKKDARSLNVVSLAISKVDVR